MFERLRGGQKSVVGRMEALEHRVAHLESLVEGIQDSIHRESRRRDDQADRLERRTEPRLLAKLLSEDARRRGL
jgi:uncharacterized coiled-coil protein SlyX